MLKVRSAQRGRGGARRLVWPPVLSFAVMIAGSSSLSAQVSSSSSTQVSAQGESHREISIVEKFANALGLPAHPQSRWQGHRSAPALVTRQAVPDCELAGLEPETVDADQWARLKLDYERHCYKQAEMLIHRQLERLVAVRPPPPLDATGSSSRQRMLHTLKLLARAVAGGPSANNDVAVEDAASPPSAVEAMTTGNVAELPSDGLAFGSSLKDAEFYRERAVASYHNGDIPVALADFDLAIWHDPNFEDAYINRGITLYRMREFNRAFDDIAQALRIENYHRACDSIAPEGVVLLNNNR